MCVLHNHDRADGQAAHTGGEQQQDFDGQRFALSQAATVHPAELVLRVFTQHDTKRDFRDIFGALLRVMITDRNFNL